MAVPVPGGDYGVVTPPLGQSFLGAEHWLGGQAAFWGVEHWLEGLSSILGSWGLVWWASIVLAWGSSTDLGVWCFGRLSTSLRVKQHFRTLNQLEAQALFGGLNSSLGSGQQLSGWFSGLSTVLGVRHCFAGLSTISGLKHLPGVFSTHSGVQC